MSGVTFAPAWSPVFYPFGTQSIVTLILPVHEAGVGGRPRVRIEPESLGGKLRSATDERCDLGQVVGLPVCKTETTAIGER